ncbi:unnamed protein product [Strongylus vulgaris]|uniref:Uncharacterized protein n=1 Tax=Strongylus vulgaris TaxID=40348 RepID=A0A3P7LJS9_STRVU|nr:unnamed protein product [Strongylus vulgaris]
MSRWLPDPHRSVLPVMKGPGKVISFRIYFAFTACNRIRSPAYWIISPASEVKTSVKLHRTPWILDQMDTPIAKKIVSCSAPTAEAVSTNANLHALLEVAGHQLPRNRLAGNKVKERT